jgi:DNA-binding CsgD family transcriptional regulator
MSRSSLLRAADVRMVFRLVGECRELGDDPAGWRRHLLAGVARLAGAAVAKVEEGVFLGSFRSTGRIEWGWETSGLDRAVFLRIQEELAHLGGGFIPMIPAYLAARRAGLGLCLSRSDVLADAQWYRTRYYQDYHVPSGVDHMMYCMLPKPGPDGELIDLTLVRPLRERRDFTSRQKAIVQELHEKITALVGGPLAGYQEPSPADLTPRVRQMLRCLLEGDSDKQAARRLGLGRHTINQYTKTIFAHFGVNGRVELLVRWLRRGWCNKCVWADPVPDLHAAQASLPNPSLADLTPRLRQTLQCFLEGNSDKQAARRLGLSRHTVHEYTKVIFARFGVSSRAELLASWIRHGWGNEFVCAEPLAVPGPS